MITINNHVNRKVHKVLLEDLQKYFDYNVFYFDDYDDSEDYDEAFAREYEEQLTGFLRSIGAMVPVEVFFNVEDDEIVYVRKVPPGIMPVQRKL